MKATGVVRRIDDLGRIVIPKEIRKTLRIKEGDPLEIFTDREGQVILKKYSPIGELSEFATEYAETLAKTTGHIACITDKDTVIAVSGGSKKEFLEQGISKDLERIIDDKEVYISKENNDRSVPITQTDNTRIQNSQVVYPIISDGDAIGSVLAMHLALKKIGKKSDILMDDLPKTYDFLPGMKDVKKENNIEKYDLVIALDASTVKVLGNYAEKFENAIKSVIFCHFFHAIAMRLIIILYFCLVIEKY